MARSWGPSQPSSKNSYFLPGDFQGITKYHSNQYLLCSKQWRTDELVDVYVSRRLMKRFSGGFLISVSWIAIDLECLIRNLIFNSLKFNQVDSF